jgi:hypothetical protein
MTRQLASRQVEREAAIDRPASVVHAMAWCRSGALALGFCQRPCQMLWQNRAVTRRGVSADWRETRQRPHLRPAATAPARASRLGWSRGRRQRGPGSWRLRPRLPLHPVERLVQVVCGLICHIVRRRWARSPVRRAVSRWVPAPIDGGLWIVPADRGRRQCSKRRRAARSPVHLGRSGPPSGLLHADVAQATAQRRLHSPVDHAGRCRRGQRAA